MIADFLKQLRALPYADMMIVARELKAMLPVVGHIDNLAPNDIAGALSRLASMPLEDAPNTTAEHKMLRQIFGRRRSISIRECNGGFELQLQTLNATVLHKDLKVGLGQLVDTVVAARALKGQ